MVATYTYPTRASMTQVANNLIQGIEGSNPIFEYCFPVINRNDIVLRWFIDQLAKGLMALRGAGGPPVRVDTVGRDYFETEPGVFGEFGSIDETELLKLGRGIPSDLAIAVSVEDRASQIQAMLMQREQNRMRQMAWTAARTGVLSIPLPGGSIGYKESYTVQSRTVSPLWSTKTTSTPLADFMANQQLYGIGTSNQYGYNAVALMNTYTSQLMFTNTNAADWGGKRSTGGGTVQGMGFYDEVRVDLSIPRIVTWDGGYIADDGTTFVLDIPNGEILVIAWRPDGEKPGEFSLTYNAVNQSTGAYSMVLDFTNDDREVPPRLEVHAGFNGGLVYHRPAQVLRMIVA